MRLSKTYIDFTGIYMVLQTSSGLAVYYLK